MRYARREGRVERVHVDANVERAVWDRHPLRRKAPHLDRLDPVAPGLLATVGVGAPDANLDEPRGQLLLHDPSEGGGMAQRIAAKILIDVGMGVEMQDRHRPAL